MRARTKPKICWPTAIGFLLFLMGLSAVPCLAGVESTLVNRPAVGDLGVYGPSLNKRIVLAPELPGKSAIHIEIPAPSPDSHPWEIGIGIATNADIHKDDHVIAAFWARSDTGTGKIIARLQSNDAPYDGITQAEISPNSNWQLFQLEGIADQDYVSGHTGLTLSLNTKQQILDVGPIYIFKNLDTSNDLQAQLRSIPLGSVRDAIIETQEGLKLAATLRIPPGNRPFPAVMIVTGSGPWGRNPNDPISVALLSHGNAVLQFDKRGVGQSTGILDTAQTSDLARDAGIIAKWLRQQPSIDPRHTGILGGSQGGMIAISVAAADPQVAFIVDMAGPAEPLGELAIRQNELAMLDAGMNPSQVAAVVKMFHEGLAALRAANGDEDAVARTKAALAPYVGTLITQADADATAERLRNSATRAMLLYDPKAALERIRVPVLGLFGTMDHQVPAEENAEALRQGLARNKDVTVLILPGFNHLFQHAKIGNVAEWKTLTEPQGGDPQLQKIVTDWVKAHTH